MVAIGVDRNDEWSLDASNLEQRSDDGDSDTDGKEDMMTEANLGSMFELSIE